MVNSLSKGPEIKLSKYVGSNLCVSQRLSIFRLYSTASIAKRFSSSSTINISSSLAGVCWCGFGAFVSRSACSFEKVISAPKISLSWVFHSGSLTDWMPCFSNSSARVIAARLFESLAALKAGCKLSNSFKWFSNAFPLAFFNAVLKPSNHLSICVVFFIP